jgi:hypothetical protein
MTEPNPFDLYVDGRIRAILTAHAQNGADFRSHTMITMQESELAALRRERDEHVCVPTADAYEAACRALEKHRDRADVLADLIDVIALQAHRMRSSDDPAALRYVMQSISERLRVAFERDQQRRANMPGWDPALAVGCPLPLCGGYPGVWCTGIGDNVPGHIHDERRVAATAPAVTGPRLACGECGNSGEKDGRDCGSCSIRAPRCPSCDHLVRFHDEQGCCHGVSVGTMGVNRVCPCSLSVESFAPGAVRDDVSDAPFETVEMRAENGVFTRVEVRGEHVAATGNGMALLSPWAAEVVGNAYLHAAREALQNAASPAPVVAPTGVCGVECTERPDKMTGTAFGQRTMRTGPCLLPVDHPEKLHDPAPPLRLRFIGFLGGERWRGPMINVACPSCGLVADRTATCWSGKHDGSIWARFACGPLGDRDKECWRLFDVDITAADVEAWQRYEEAKAAGLSDAEAREEGWPTAASDGACVCGGLDGTHTYRGCSQDNDPPTGQEATS